MTSLLVVTSEKSAFHPKVGRILLLQSKIHKLPRNTASVELLPKFKTPAATFLTLQSVFVNTIHL